MSTLAKKMLNEYRELQSARVDLEYRGNRFGAALEDALRKKIPVGKVINIHCNSFRLLFGSCDVFVLKGGEAAYLHRHDSKFSVIDNLSVEFDPVGICSSCWSVRVHPFGPGKKKLGDQVLLLRGTLVVNEDGDEEDMLVRVFGK